MANCIHMRQPLIWDTTSQHVTIYSLIQKFRRFYRSFFWHWSIRAWETTRTVFRSFTSNHCAGVLFVLWVLDNFAITWTQFKVEWTESISYFYEVIHLLVNSTRLWWDRCHCFGPQSMFFISRSYGFEAIGLLIILGWLTRALRPLQGKLGDAALSWISSDAIRKAIFIVYWVRCIWRISI